MASTFTALPLEDGESFVLQTLHEGSLKTILYDSGTGEGEGKENRLFKALNAAFPDLNQIDIAVCSHNDNDHSSGFPEFIRAWQSAGKQIGELWLPFLFAEITRAVIEKPKESAKAIADGAMAVAMNMPAEGQDAFLKMDSAGRRAEAERLWEQARRNRPRPPSTPGGDVLTSNVGDRTSLKLQHASEDRIGTTKDFADPATVAESLRTFSGHGETVMEQLRSDTATTRGARIQANLAQLSQITREVAYLLTSKQMETAKAIVMISSGGFVPAIPIRWFDFAFDDSPLVPGGGVPGLLEPVSARQVVVSKTFIAGKAERSISESLSLTEANVEALVFIRPETKTEPAVLFLADSRLATGIARPKTDFPAPAKLPQHPFLFTAAHHASKNNDNAYKVLGQWFGESTAWQEAVSVRNGGQKGMQIIEWANIPKVRRRCAQCIQCHGSGWQQTVTVVSEEGKWQWPPANCKECGDLRYNPKPDT